MTPIHAAPPATASRIRRVPSYVRAIAGMLGRDIVPFLRMWLPIRQRVRGWLRGPDALLLFRLARRGPGTGGIVEIGSAWGKSTICLASGSRLAGREIVTAIDPHTGDAWFLDEVGAQRIDSFAEFSANVERAGCREWVKPIVKTSEAAALEPAEPVRLLFIDGLHTYEAVQQDIADWVPRVVPGGVVIFDDYDNTAPGVGVKRAVDDLLRTGLVDPTLRRGFNLVWTVRPSHSD